MSSEEDKKKEKKDYALSQANRDRSFDTNCRRSGDSYGLWSGGASRQRYFCKNCYRVGNEMKNCPTCNATTVRLDQRARVPKKDASKKKWKQFFANFFPDLLDRII